MDNPLVSMCMKADYALPLNSSSFSSIMVPCQNGLNASPLPQILAANLLRLAHSVAMVLLLLVETLRFGCVPIVGTAIDQFMARFMDVRDAGPIVWTHLSLLIGMAAPLWLTPVVDNNDFGAHGDGFDSRCHCKRVCASLAGVVSLGIGDTFAAIIGSR